MTHPGEPAGHDDAVRRWREWSGTADSASPAPVQFLPGPPPLPIGPAGAGSPGPGGLTARTMALTGTSLISGLALLLMLLTALPGGSLGSPATSSSVNPAGAVTAGGPSCVAATGDLLCWEKARSSRSGQSIHDPLISIEGPGTLAVEGPGLMIDGDPQTSWVSAGDATGASILLEFNEPVVVGTVGITTRETSGGQVLYATWSFANEDGSSNRPCGASGDEFGNEVHQNLSGGSTMKVPHGVSTCSVRVHIDRLASVDQADGSGSTLAISELTLLAA